MDSVKACAILNQIPDAVRKTQGIIFYLFVFEEYFMPQINIIKKPTKEDYSRLLNNPTLNLSDNVRSMVYEVLVEGHPNNLVAARYEISPSAVSQNVNRVANMLREDKIPSPADGEVLICMTVPADQAQKVKQLVQTLLK